MSRWIIVAVTIAAMLAGAAVTARAWAIPTYLPDLGPPRLTDCALIEPEWAETNRHEPRLTPVAVCRWQRRWCILGMGCAP